VPGRMQIARTNPVTRLEARGDLHVAGKGLGPKIASCTPSTVRGGVTFDVPGAGWPLSSSSRVTSPTLTICAASAVNHFS
jgi:hypothetical protein